MEVAKDKQAQIILNHFLQTLKKPMIVSKYSCEILLEIRIRLNMAYNMNKVVDPCLVYKAWRVWVVSRLCFLVVWVLEEFEKKNIWEKNEI